MKNLFTKNTEPKYFRLINNELINFIESTDVVLVSKHQKTAQRVASMDFKNFTKEAKIKDFLGTMKSDYQRLIVKIDQTLAGALSEFKSSQDIQNAKEVIADLSRKIKEIENTLVILKGKVDESSEKLTSKVESWIYQKVWILYFLAGFELIANYSVYQLLGGGVLGAVSISLISAIAIFWWGHITPKYVVQYGADNPKKRVLLFILFATPVVVLFYLFSQMRISSLIISNPEMAKVFVSSPSVPTLINFFGYLIACYLVHNYRPSKEEINVYKKNRKDKNDISKLNKEREQLIKQRNNQIPELQNKLTGHYNFLLLAQQLESDVKNRYVGCFEEFKGELYLRTNSKCAVLFSESQSDLPPLELNYQSIDKTQFEL